MVDDDNVLAPDYLETAVRSAEDRPELGAFGGKCLPEFEHEPPEWLAARGKGLGLRDRGEREEFFPEAAIAGSWQPSVGSLQSGEDGRLTAESANRNIVEIAGGKQVARRTTDTEDVKLRLTEFPDCAPIGAGMVLRRDAAAAYAERIEQQTKRLKDQETITDRKGDSLASGGDNDICLTVVEEGWQVGYLPQLQLTHLIPKGRMTLDYHKRMARDSMKSFILMLDQHGIRPWPAMAKWTLPLRVASDLWRVKPWRGAEQSLHFWGHVGMYEGRAALPAQPPAAGVGG
jgi:GT2 family glycosyltransferase